MFVKHTISRTIYAANTTKQPNHLQVSQNRRLLKLTVDQIVDAKMQFIYWSTHTTKIIFACLFVWVFWHINHYKFFNAKPIFIQINSSILTIQFYVITQFYCQKHFYFKLLSLV